MDGFRMEDYRPEAREARLEPPQLMALAKTLELAEKRFPRLSRPAEVGSDGPDGGGLRGFLLPFAAFGMDPAQMLGLLEKLPEGWTPSHREIYFDFRLGRWQRHIEPPTLEECLEEHLASAASEAEGLAWLKDKWAEFLRRHGG